MKKYSILFLIFVYFFGFSQNKEEFIKKYENYFELLAQNKEKNNTDSVLFYGRQALLFAQKLDDPVLTGKVYISTGNYYYQENESSSIAYENYHKAYESYLKAKDTLKVAKTLLRMGILEKNVRNYTKAKESLFTALDLIGEQQPDFLESIYNDLGIVFDHLGNLSQSILYYKKSLTLRLQSGDKRLIIQSLNNIATTYKDHQNYANAEKYFAQAFKFPKSELEKYPDEYARLIDNRAHLYFLKGNMDQILPDYLKALEIRKNSKIREGIIMSNLHLAQYYRQVHNYNFSDGYAEDAYKESYGMQSFRDALTALSIIRDNAKSSGNLSRSLEYGNRYNLLLNKLFDQEMKTEEKFADIRYAASQKEKENKNLRLQNKEQQLLTEKRRKYLYIAIGLFGVIALAGIGYIQFSRMEQKQKEQKAEKEIISLLFERQEAAEQAKHLEQERISNDLHDSIAGKLSGLMLKLDTIAISSPAEVKKKLAPAVEHVDVILQELTSIVHDMNEQQIISVTYPVLIEEIAKSQLSEKILFSFFIDHSIDWDKISNQIKLAFYYIIQQGVRNINEHSGACRASVEIRSEDNIIFLAISDNGTGFGKESSSGIGISGMRKRTQELGGKLELQSEKDKETTITIKIPLS